MSFNFSPFPVLNSRDFLLRELSMQDDREIFRLRSDPEVLKYVDRIRAESIEDAREFIRKILSGIYDNKNIYWVICSKNESSLLGTICLWNLHPESLKADIGFELLPEHQGKNIMQQVIPTVLDYGFNVMNLNKITGEASPLNLKSIRLMEHFGFKYESESEGYSVYSLDKTTYKKKPV